MVTAIVAIPTQQDYVWNISSEEIPHMTLLALEDEPDNLLSIVEFVGHATQNSNLGKFGLCVDKRGTLGADNADVLFFDKNDWSYRQVAHFRAMLLQDPNIKTSYDSVEQFPDWIPHLTLGYPEAPAKADKRDYPGFSYIQFDKIAIWPDNFSGPEFDLKSERSMEVFMSDLAHYGKKGMKWGVRNSTPGGRVTNFPGRKVSEAKDLYKARKASIDADRARDVSDEAARKQEGLRIARNAGLDRLSNKELQSMVTRMNLEQQYSQLTKGQNVLFEQRAQRILKNNGLNLAKVAITKDVKQFTKDFDTAIKNDKKTDYTRLDQRKSQQHLEKIAPDPNQKKKKDKDS